MRATVKSRIVWLKALTIMVAAANAACFPGPLDCADPKARCELGTDSESSDGPDATSDTNIAETRQDTSDSVSVLTCEDLACEDSGRQCLDGDDGEDAACGECLATHLLVSGVCVPRPAAPTGVTASMDRSADISVSWSPAANATGYRVYRCDVTDCSAGANWTLLTSEPQTATTFVDTSADGPATPEAPSSVNATRSLTSRVDVTWDAVTAPQAPRYRYRVTSEGAGVEGPPSVVVLGARAEQPIVGYEISIDDGAWEPVPGGLVTTWSDSSAQPATLVAPSASASLGTFPGFVRLNATGAIAANGAARSFQVRAFTALGVGAISSASSGWRVAGPLGYQWERSAGASAEDFAPVQGATDETFDDTHAPADGSTRWYRVAASAPGADSVVSLPVPGARQGPPGVPAAVRASNDLPDRVLVEWQAVPDAVGYHVYRDGTRLTTGSGVTASSYPDFDAPAIASEWTAPTGVSASTDAPSNVTVQWVAPPRPEGAAASYRVSAVSAAGEGTLSPSASGKLLAAALVGYEVETTPLEGTAAWFITGSTSTSWLDARAPAGSIVGGTIDVTQGKHLNFVRLASFGESTVDGSDVVYRVRGIQAGGAYTPVSASATGRRTVGILGYQWQRSRDVPPYDLIDLVGATSAAYDDLTAPVDGSKTYFRLVLSAPGAESVEVGLSEGWRLAFVDVTTGGSHSCALSRYHEIWCWGNNAEGQLGVGYESPPLEPVKVEAPEGDYFSVAAGSYHTCAMTHSNVYCWGENSSGQIGDGTRTRRPTPTLVGTLSNVAAIGVGQNSSYAVVGSEGRAWGHNDKGQLGDGTEEHRSTPVTVLGPSGTAFYNVRQFVGGYAHTCALRVGGDVWCRGWGYNGQIGDGLFEDSLVPVAVQGLPAVEEIAAGAGHTCARLVSGEVRCWGGNSAGQLGDDSTTKRGSPVAVASLDPADEIAAAFETSCARLGASVYCWGSDFNGLLGDGGEDDDANYSILPVRVLGLIAPTAIGSGPASRHICAVDNYAVRCWGFNYLKQLGDGTTINRTSAVTVVFP